MRFLLLVGFCAVVGCTASPVESTYVARVGTQTLSQDELSTALQGLTLGVDSADAARQIIEQWATKELMFAESRRRGLDRDPEVRSRVLEAERAVMVDALIDRLYAEEEADPTNAEIQAYFERSRERLRLLEPYVRLRYLAMADAEVAQTARRRLARMDTSDHAEWETLAREVSSDPGLSITLSRSFVPETRAFGDFPILSDALGALAPGRTTLVLGESGQYHVIQLLQRVPAGTLPERAWIEESLRQQLRIESRKLLYARLVQRLRNEALAREQLDLNPSQARSPAGS